MTETSGRQLGVLDMMILVAAIAMGIGMTKNPYEQMNPGTVNFARSPAMAILHWGALVYPLITPITIATAVLGLRRGGLARGEAMKSVGIVASAAATLALAVRGVGCLPAYLRGTTYHAGPVYPWIETSRVVGYAVLGAAAVAWLKGERPERRGVLHWLGCLLGGLWVLGVVGGIAFEFHQNWDRLLQWWDARFGV